jgi:hypothetical protein
MRTEHFFTTIAWIYVLSISWSKKSQVREYKKFHLKLQLIWVKIQVGRRRRGIEAFFYRQNHIEYFFRAACIVFSVQVYAN